MKNGIHSLIVFALIFVSASCRRAENVDVEWSSKEEKLSVKCNQQKLGDVVRAVEEKTGFGIFVPGNPDSLVTTSFTNLPLNVALDSLLGSGRPYMLDTKLNELTLKANEGAKRGKKTATKESTESKPRPDTTQKRSDLPRTGEKLKSSPDTTARATRFPQTRNLKPPPDQVKGAEAKGKAGAASDPDDARARYYKFRLQFDQEKVSVKKIITMTGRLVHDTIMNRDYLLIIQSDGQVLSASSFDDPLIMHSHNPDPNKEHEVLKKQKGTVDVLVPDGFRQKENATVNIYRSTGVITTPLTTESVQKNKGNLVQIASFKLSELSNYFTK